MKMELLLQSPQALRGLQGRQPWGLHVQGQVLGSAEPLSRRASSEEGLLSEG